MHMTLYFLQHTKLFLRQIRHLIFFTVLLFFLLCFSAASVYAASNDTIEHALTLTNDITYQNKISSDTTHYYCVYNISSQKSEVRIFIRTKEVSSFSFQLFDDAGQPITPDTYEYQPDKRKLSVQYLLKKHKGYIFTLTNLQNAAANYTIRSQVIHPHAKHTPKPSGRPKRTTTRNSSSQRKVQPTVPSGKTPHEKSADTAKSAAPVNQSPISSLKPTDAPKRTKHTRTSLKNKIKKKTSAKRTRRKDTIGKNREKTSGKKRKTQGLLQFADSFSQHKTGSVFSLKCVFHSDARQDLRSIPLSYKCSDPSVLSIQTSTPVLAGRSAVTLKALKKGVVTLQCRTAGSARTSASCTIKIY